ncbi:hypothetical protein, partial [Nitrospina gracilis]|uniref:hypothetical protein n=1 Tax=Nitrospina gracilis TaxID=35801 RepID=UPI001C9E1CD0
MNPFWGRSSGPFKKISFFRTVKVTVGLNRIFLFVTVRHGLRKRGEANIGNRRQGQGRNEVPRTMIGLFVKTETVLAVQGFRQLTQPSPVRKRCAGPERAGMIEVNDLVPLVQTIYPECGAQHLGG